MLTSRRVPSFRREASVPKGTGPRFHSVASSSGFTLLELITVITLLGLLLGRTIPAGRRLQDRMAVIGAREAVVGLFHRARSEAVARGGATLVLTRSEEHTSELQSQQ